MNSLDRISNPVIIRLSNFPHPKICNLIITLQEGVMKRWSYRKVPK